MSDIFPSNACTCMRPWNSVLPPPPCPIHGHAMTSDNFAPGLGWMITTTGTAIDFTGEWRGTQRRGLRGRLARALHRAADRLEG